MTIPAQASGDDRERRVLTDPTLDTLRAAGSHPIMLSFPEVMVITFDRDLRYLSVGGAGLATTGLSPEIMVGRTIFEVFDPDLACTLEPLYRAAVAGQESTVEVTFGGREYAQHLAPVRDRSGRPVAGMGFGQDVTAERAAERLLRASEERFRVSFEHAPIGKALISLDGRYEQTNPAMSALTGYTAEQLRELTVREITHPDDVPADERAAARLLDGSIATCTMEKRYRTAAGTDVWASKSVSLARDGEGLPLHFIAQVQDISERKEHERLLAEERRRLDEAQSIGRLGSWELDVASGTVTRSAALLRLYGVHPERFSGIQPAVRGLIDPHDQRKVDAALATCIRTGAPVRTLYRLRRPIDGSLRYFEAHGRRVTEPGRPPRVVGAVVDVTAVTEQVRADAEASAASAFQQAVMDASPDIIYVYDVESGSTVWANRSLTELLGYSKQELDELGGIGVGLMPDGEHELFRAAVVAACSAGDSGVVQLNHRLRHADGTDRWFSQRTTPLHRDTHGRVTRLVGALRDITDAMAVQKRIEHTALHDDLTGLPNRALLVDRLESALARSRRDRREVAVLYCDLDGFKRVNDTAGHAAGDAVLVETAHRLESAVRDGDTVARVGGDEFVIIVEPWNRPEPSDGPGGIDIVENTEDPPGDAPLGEAVAARVADLLHRPIAVKGIEHVVTFSVGITYGRVPTAGSDNPTSADDVLQDADAAMYRAKGRGKDRVEVFEQSMRTDLTERGRVEQALRAALRPYVRLPQPPIEGFRKRPPELTAAYQPVFDSGNGALVSFEALARLTDEHGVDIPPDTFISVAEETGLIRPLGARMLELACSQIAAWRAQMSGLADVSMAVNVSALQAQQSYLADDVHRVLAENHLAAADLVLELTETALLHAARSTITNLHVLHDEGVGVAIDDFGTGYASLRYLATLPVSAVKVDKSFTANLPDDEISCKIVRAVAGLAADMGLDCIVEGVETDAQNAALPQGVQLQGFLTGRPERPHLLDVRDLVAHGMN